MNTITIPRKITKGEELVIVPRKIYEEYLELRKTISIVKMTKVEKHEWRKAEKDYQRGKYITLEEFERELDTPHKREG